MRVISRFVLISALAVAGATTVAAAPAQAVRPALDCEWNGVWYPNHWAGELPGGGTAYCWFGVWHMH
jgi:hypothetical protein